MFFSYSLSSSGVPDLGLRFSPSFVLALHFPWIKSWHSKQQRERVGKLCTSTAWQQGPRPVCLNTGVPGEREPWFIIQHLPNFFAFFLFWLLLGLLSMMLQPEQQQLLCGVWGGLMRCSPELCECASYLVKSLCATSLTHFNGRNQRLGVKWLWSEQDLAEGRSSTSGRGLVKAVWLRLCAGWSSRGTLDLVLGMWRMSGEENLSLTTL